MTAEILIDIYFNYVLQTALRLKNTNELKLLGMNKYMNY